MLFSITLHYLHSPEALKFHSEAHKNWLAESIRAGNIIFAGPVNDGSGGYILAQYADETELTRSLSADPFVSFGLVETEFRALTAAICAEPFARQWAADSKAIPINA
ncbi:hypothetical protein N172_12090 [Pantoea dispersa EGD-AAK13]|uniref:YciI family protein n=1 Tax=Pantoea dispersa TaxID=59814 RepID=UPI0003982171|nr:YciI family protein [Pantoea dispersa]ERH61984.1 hypothetical protein N172_12090 [Pantoea dispersa EGD-AAK13]